MYWINEVCVFGLVLGEESNGVADKNGVLVGGQNVPPAEPGAATRVSGAGSYSDFPGGIVPAKAPKDTNRNTVTSNNLNLPPIAKDSSSYSAVNRNIGPTNGPSESSRGSTGHGNVEPTSIPTASSSSSVGQDTVRLSNVPVPVATGSYSGPRHSAHRGIPVFHVAARELTQAAKKSRPPLSTGTDTWTPLGLSGSGKPWAPQAAPQRIAQNLPQPVKSNQKLPYDASQFKMTIGEQILQKQKKQQQQPNNQAYDIFGFAMNNVPDPLADLVGVYPPASLLAPVVPSPDPFFGSFGGAIGGSNQGGTGMWNTGGLFGGSNPNVGMPGGLNQGGHGATGNMLQTLYMMQLFGGGADAPDPQPTGAGRGRGRVQVAQPPLTPLSALEQLLRLEEIKQIRNRQRENVYRNRSRQEQQRRGQFPQHTQSSGKPHKQPSTPGAHQQPFPQRPGSRMNVRVHGITDPQQPSSVHSAINNIPRPTTRSSAIFLRPSSTLSFSPPRGNRHPSSSTHPSHPEVIDRRNMPPPTAAPRIPGQEPVEREGQRRGQGQGVAASQRQQTAPPREIERKRWNRYKLPRNTGIQINNVPSASGGYNVGSQDQYPSPVPDQGRHQGNRQHQYNKHATNVDVGNNQMSSTIPRNIQTQFKTPSTFGVAKFGGRHTSNTIPRNMKQLIKNQLFQRRLRTLGATPGANMADVRADHADLMADRADNLQSMNPFQRLLQGTGMSGTGLGGLSGFGGMPGGLRGTPTSGSLMAGMASLLGGGGAGGGLLPLALLG